MTKSHSDRTGLTPRVEDLLSSRFVGRKFDRELKLCETARLVITFCRYRRAADHWCYVRPASRHDIYGGRRGQTSLFVVDLASPMRWHDEVYGRGLACASGCFVFRVIEELDEGALIVLAGVQGRGCSLRLAYALARPRKGAWQLSRKGLTGKYRAHPPRPQPLTADDYYRQALRRRVLGTLDAMLGPPPGPLDG